MALIIAMNIKAFAHLHPWRETCKFRFDKQTLTNLDGSCPLMSTGARHEHGSKFLAGVRGSHKKRGAYVWSILEFQTHVPMQASMDVILLYIMLLSTFKVIPGISEWKRKNWNTIAKAKKTKKTFVWQVKKLPSSSISVPLLKQFFKLCSILLFNVLGTLPGQLFLDTLLDTCLSEPCLGTCSWEHCLVTCSWELSFGNLFLETSNLFMGTLLGNLFFVTLLGNLV